MKAKIFLLLILISCTSRTDRINKRLIVLNSMRDSLTIQYRMLQIINDSLKHVEANNKDKSGQFDSTTEVNFFKNQRMSEEVLREANTVSRQIEELELVR